MEKDINKNLNLFELETLRRELLSKIPGSSSNLKKLTLLLNFFEQITLLNKPNIEEAFLKEFLDDYLSVVKKFEVWGTNPGFSKKLTENLKSIYQKDFADQYKILFTDETERLVNQLQKQQSILSGESSESQQEAKTFFPLIDKEASDDFYGLIDSITTRINKSNDKDRFLIIPSESEIEKRIEEQCKVSWQLAIKLSKQYIKKTYQYHEVLISFDKKFGFYQGNSLGIALTLSFLEQILKFYNPVYVINIKDHCAFTGGVNITGSILETGEEIIKQKVKTIFYSEINTFVLPKTEETYAYFALTQLKQKYPDRNLKLIPVEDINDVLNRRDIVDIKKQKLVVRTGKFVKKNWISAVATVLLAILFAYLFILDFDDNPYAFSVDGMHLYIKNKNGKILWRKNYFAGKEEIKDIRLCKSTIRIIDTNNDGANEVLVTAQFNSETKLINTNYGLFCYDYKGKLMWRHKFNLRVKSLREDLGEDYGIRMIGEINYLEKKQFYLAANNKKSFSSAIYSIDIEKNEMQRGVLWCSGHTGNFIFLDYDKDGKDEIIGLGWDNGYEDVTLICYKPDTNVSVRQSTPTYQILGYPLAKLLFYIRIPKTDFDNYYEHRTSSIPYGSFNFFNDDSTFNFIIGSFQDKTAASYGIYFNYDLSIKDIQIANDFRVRRDTLVAHGKLNFPYTDTEEYKEIIKNSILYWKNGKWVNRKGVEKK